MNWCVLKPAQASEGLVSFFSTGLTSTRKETSVMG